MTNAHNHVEIEKEKEEDGKEQTYIANPLPDVMCFSILGIQSKLMVFSSDPMIIIGVWQLKERMKFNPYFS
jgi:hypothetical protein